MPDFNPDEYLKTQTKSSDFNPDSYLSKNGVQKKNGFQESKPTVPSLKAGGIAGQGFQTSTSQPIAPTILTPEKQQEYIKNLKTYTKPKAKPKTLREAVDDDDSYLGALWSNVAPHWNTVVGSISDAVGGAANLLAKAEHNNVGMALDIGAKAQDLMTIGYSKALGVDPEMPVHTLRDNIKGNTYKAGDKLGKYASETIELARSSASTKDNEEKIQSGFDISDGFSTKDLKALPIMLTRLGADIGLSIPTGGASFIAQGYKQGIDDYDESIAKSGVEPDDNTRELFGMGYSIVNGVADKIGANAILKNSPVKKSVQNAILRLGIKQLAKTEGKITSEVLEKTFTKVAQDTFSKIRTAGVKSLTAGATEGGTEAVQGGLSDALKIITNKVKGEDVFNQKEVLTDFWKNRLNDFAGGAVLGGFAGGATNGFRSSKSYVAERVAESTSPEQLQNLKDELYFEVEQGTLEEERAVELNTAIDKYSEIAQRIPTGAKDRIKAIQLIEERDALKEAKNTAQSQAENLDEALAPQIESEMSLLQNKEDQLNDQIREKTTGDKYKYFKDPEKDKYYKQLGEGKPEDITQEYYDLQKQDTHTSKLDETIEVRVQALPDKTFESSKNFFGYVGGNIESANTLNSVYGIDEDGIVDIDINKMNRAYMSSDSVLEPLYNISEWPTDTSKDTLSKFTVSKKPVVKIVDGKVEVVSKGEATFNPNPQDNEQIPETTDTTEQVLPEQELQGESQTIEQDDTANPTEESVDNTEILSTNDSEITPEKSIEVDRNTANTEAKQVVPETDDRPLKDTGKDTFESLSAKVPDSGELDNYLSGKTIEKYEGDNLRNDQSYEKKGLKLAAEHGIKIINSAKEQFGDEYVAKTLESIEGGSQSIDAKALTYVSLENDLAKRKLEEPENELEISKLQDLVRAKSQAYLRANSIAINMGRIRKLGEVGYDLDQVTDQFFSTPQREAKNKINKAVQADADAIQKEAESQEIESLQDNETIDAEVEKAISEGVAKEIEQLYGKLPTKRKERADKAIEALERIQKRLRSKAYDATIGVPVAIIDAGITTIKAAIKAGVNIADAIELGINKIKERHGKSWSKESQFRKDMLDGFKAEGVELKTGSRILTPQEKLSKAKENIKARIETIKQEIIDKKRQLNSSSKKPVTDAELARLRAEEDALIDLRDKYLPKETKAFTDEKTRERMSNKLLAEIESINKQIKAGEKAQREAKKDPYTSPEITKLKAEKEARLQILDQIDPNPKEFVKTALIEAGFGRDITVTTKAGKEKRSIIDWKKLAGEEGSVTKIQDYVEKALKGNGYSDAQIIRMQDAFVKEYTDLRASIVEKSLNELNKLNTPKEPINHRSSARRLAELYNLGLFEKDADTYEYLVNKSLGMGIKSQELFNELKGLALALSELYNTKDVSTGKTLPEFAIRQAIREVNFKISDVLTRTALQESNTAYKIARATSEYLNLAQRAMLTTMKQYLENPFSGLIQRVFSRAGYFFDKTDSNALAENRKVIASAVKNDIVKNGGLFYGDVSTPLVSRSIVEDKINQLSDSQIYHAGVSALIGRTFLEGADSYNKTFLTEKYFQYNLIKVLTDKTNPNRISKEEAVRYVTEKLTGQSFEDAKNTAQKLIKDTNQRAGKTILPDNPQQVIRLANEIVNMALVNGSKVTQEQLEASYNSAYKAAGMDLGHEANNPISDMVANASAFAETKVQKAIREKNWNKAAAFTMLQVINRNVLNPFVGGGTNWMVLTFQKAGFDPISPIYYAMQKSKIDLSTESGIKELQTTLFDNMRSKNTNIRFAIGAVASVLTYAMVKGTDADETYEVWLKKNNFAKKYLDIFPPSMFVLLMSIKDKEMGRYYAKIFGTSFNEGEKLVKALTELSSGKKKKVKQGQGKVGEILGSRLSTPIIPWRMARDLISIAKGIAGVKEKKPDYKVVGFWNGFYKGGLVEHIGLRPDKKK